MEQNPADEPLTPPPVLPLPPAALALRTRAAYAFGERGAGRRQLQLLVLEAADFVAQGGGLLELEIGGGGAHALVEVRDIGPEVVADRVWRRRVAGAV